MKREFKKKRDVKFHMSSTAQNNNDVTGKKKEHGIKPKETKRQADLPLVAVLYDSVLNGVQGKRLGRSYGFEKNYNIEETVKSLESVAGSVKTIVVHLGIMILEQKISKDHPNLKIVSKIPSVKDTNLQAKRDLFNALVCSELVENPDVSFVAHENLHFASLKDTIYPSIKGLSVLSRNLGRHIHNLFWERPRRLARCDLLQPYKLHQQQCRDPFGWQNCRQSWLRW